MRLTLFLLFLSFFAAAQQDILILGNHTSVCLDESYKFVTADSLPLTLDKFNVIMMFSNSTSVLTNEDVERIVEFVNKGGGLYSGAENWPLQAESNQITKRLYKKESFGKYNQVNAEFCQKRGNLLLEGLDSIPAGSTTVAFPMDYRLKVEAWIDDQPLILSGEIGKGRVIIDGGYSRFYCIQRGESSDKLFQQYLAFLLRVN